MDEFNSDIEGTLDFLVLNAFSDGPLSGSAIEQRVERMHMLLELAAERKGMRSPESLPTVLQRLENAGWLNPEWQRGEQSRPEKIYSLTAEGKQQLEEEWTRRGLTLSRFVEDGGLDESFRKFLNRTG